MKNQLLLLKSIYADKFQFIELNKSELTELFRARDASCPKGKKMNIRNEKT